VFEKPTGADSSGHGEALEAAPSNQVVEGSNPSGRAMQSEKALLSLDPQAQLALRRELARAVRRVCPRFLAQEADDLVQESFLRLLKASRADSVDGLSAAYLKKVAYSAVVDEIRRRRRQLALDAGAEGGDIEAAADERRSMPEPAVGNAIAACLQRLQPDRRRALTLHLLGHSGSEVARLLVCDAKRAENLTLRGLAQLRECLHDKGVKP
jgi:RNA polymerase sigma-70 factor, ECF subfamily